MYVLQLIRKLIKTESVDSKEDGKREFSTNLLKLKECQFFNDGPTVV